MDEFNDLVECARKATNEDAENAYDHFLIECELDCINTDELEALLEPRRPV